MRQLKGFIAGFIVACLLVVPTTALADNVQAQFNTVNITVDGKNSVKQGENLQLSDGSMVPFSITYKGTTYLPVRKMSELLSLGIDYDNATKTVNVISNANNTKDQTPSTTTNQTTTSQPVINQDKTNQTTNDQNKTNQQAANTEKKPSTVTDKTTGTEANKANSVTQDLKVASSGYGVVDTLFKATGPAGNTVQKVYGYCGQKGIDALTSDLNIVNGWKEVEWNKDGCNNAFLYKFDFASNGVIVGAEKVQASVGPTKIESYDKRILTLNGNTYKLADDAVIYEVDERGDYKFGAIFHSSCKYIIQLFDTDSSKEGYEYAIISDYE